MAFRCLATLEAPSGLPEDRMVNTWHFFDPFQVPIATAAADIAAGLDAFYSTLADQTPEAYTRLPYKVYDLKEDKPRTPFEVPYGGTQPSSTAQILPAEVAVVLSFYSEKNSPRRRGRIYHGPLTVSNMVDASGATTGPRVSVGMRTRLLNGAQALFDSLVTAGNVSWAVYSRKEGQAHPVSHAWVDDAFDTQRRRGVDAQERTLVNLGNPE